MKIMLKNEGNINFNNKYHIELTKSNRLIEIDNNYLSKVVKPQQTIVIEIKLIFVSREPPDNSFLLCFKLVDDKNKNVSGSVYECNFIINRDEDDDNYSNSNDVDNEYNEEDKVDKKMKNKKKKNSFSSEDNDNEKENENENKNKNDNNNSNKNKNINLNFSNKISDDEFEKIYSDLNEEYNLLSIGKEKDFIKIKINEILQKENIEYQTKDDLIEIIKEKLLDFIF